MIQKAGAISGWAYMTALGMYTGERPNTQEPARRERHRLEA